MKWSNKPIQITSGKSDVLLMTSLSRLLSAREGGFLSLAQRFLPPRFCSASRSAQSLLPNYHSLNIQLTMFIRPYTSMGESKKHYFCLLSKFFSLRSSESVLRLLFVVASPGLLFYFVSLLFVLQCPIHNN